MTFTNQKQSEWNNFRDPKMPPPLAKAFPSKLTPAPPTSKPPVAKGKSKKI